MMTDPEETKSHFDLLNVIIAEEEMAARPTEFTYDDNEDVTGVTKYETVCPRCSELVEFSIDKIMEDEGGKLYVQGCNDCPITANTEAVLTVEGADFDSILNDDTFEDPIVNGKMVIEGAIKLNV